MKLRRPRPRRRYGSAVILGVMVIFAALIASAPAYFKIIKPAEEPLNISIKEENNFTGSDKLNYLLNKNSDFIYAGQYGGCPLLLDRTLGKLYCVEPIGMIDNDQGDFITKLKKGDLKLVFITYIQ